MGRCRVKASSLNAGAVVLEVRVATVAVAFEVVVAVQVPLNVP
jgi:hypothetical protein